MEQHATNYYQFALRMMAMYEDIKIVLGTKHKKEQAIEQPFKEAFNATIVVPNDYDTDQFGTFTGEIPRVDNQYETVVKKAKEAAFRYKFDYGLANEGSFGPHPTIFFAPADIELLCFVDNRHDIQVTESEITTETNYAYLDIKATDSYTTFLQKISFGSHGLVVRSLDDNAILAKGITELKVLNQLLDSAFKKYTTLRLETDMRAMMNPTRMRVINQLAKKLVKRLQQICKQCQTPGFGKISVKGNLPCEDCGSETELYALKVLSCVKCDYQEFAPRSDALQKADSKYCPYCNP